MSGVDDYFVLDDYFLLPPPLWRFVVLLFCVFFIVAIVTYAYCPPELQEGIEHGLGPIAALVTLYLWMQMESALWRLAHVPIK